MSAHLLTQLAAAESSLLAVIEVQERYQERASYFRAEAAIQETQQATDQYLDAERNAKKQAQSFGYQADILRARIRQIEVDLASDAQLQAMSNEAFLARIQNGTTGLLSAEQMAAMDETAGVSA